MTDYAGLVEYIVRNMVDHPDAVVVEAGPGRGRSQTIEISLDPEDVGRVIGKGGRNIEAIRAVVKAASIKDHERVNVEVLADDLPPAERADEENEAQGHRQPRCRRARPRRRRRWQATTPRRRPPTVPRRRMPLP